uniref:Uncharacterized protein n=1 Tax=Acrobeloides nanus TaxID=290746 RepID=A0A914DZL1_9BILA
MMRKLAKKQAAKKQVAMKQAAVKQAVVKQAAVKQAVVKQAVVKQAAKKQAAKKETTRKAVKNEELIIAIPRKKAAGPDRITVPTLKTLVDEISSSIAMFTNRCILKVPFLLNGKRPRLSLCPRKATHQTQETTARYHFCR